MIDAHTHIVRGETRNFICEPFSSEKGVNDVAFYGVHPWDYAEWDGGERLRTALAADPSAGVGEIGLDRMKDRNIPQAMRDVFASQLEIAAEFNRGVVLHGAKCWAVCSSPTRTCIVALQVKRYIMALCLVQNNYSSFVTFSQRGAPATDSSILWLSSRL